MQTKNVFGNYARHWS